jgi:hypothetical protein
MATYFKTNRFLLFVLFVAFVLTACKNQQGSGNNEKGKQSNQTLTSGMLYSLYADSSSFLGLDSTMKVVFVVTFTQDTILTLHGWSSKGDVFKTPPNIILDPSTPSNVHFGNGMYLGNVILKKKDLKDVQDSVRKRKDPFILFTPYIINGNHFGYSLSTTRDDPQDFTKQIVSNPTGADMNPSPPKNY